MRCAQWLHEYGWRSFASRVSMIGDLPSSIVKRDTLGGVMDEQQGQPRVTERFPFLKDAGLSDDLKKFLVEKSIEAGNAAWTRQFEVRKWRWSTPLAVALTGVITVAVNFVFDHYRAQQAQMLQDQSGDSEAKRKAGAAEREFEFKIVERELSQSKSEAERASVLLFLVRAGVLNGLNATELRTMAEASLRREGKPADAIIIPPLASRAISADKGLSKDIQSDEDILDLILKWEGGFANVPGDPGGASNAGITLGGLSKYLGRDATIDELRGLDRATISDFYKKSYFDAARGISNPQVRAALVNLMVLAGTSRATKDFQEALGKVIGKEVNVDGVLGAMTTQLINAAPDPDLLIEYANCAQLQASKSLPAFSRFGRGWTNRLRGFSPTKLQNICPDLGS
jgi:glycosyl hydrolase family 108/predicted peptidoglycan binding protein